MQQEKRKQDETFKSKNKGRVQQKMEESVNRGRLTVGTKGGCSEKSVGRCKSINGSLHSET